MQFKAAVLSPYGDLQHHRARSIQVLRKHGFFVDPMEDWSADAQEPKELCRKRLDGCHLCVLLVGRRRGITPDGESRSITQIEYDEARRLGIDVLVLLLDDHAPWPAEWDESKSDPQLAAWRADAGRRESQVAAARAALPVRAGLQRRLSQQ